MRTPYDEGYEKAEAELYDQHVAECPNCYLVSRGKRIFPLFVQESPRGQVLRCRVCGCDYRLVQVHPPMGGDSITFEVRIRESGNSTSADPPPGSDEST